MAYLIIGGEVYHHGIKGMRWGVRRDQRTLDRLAGRQMSAEARTMVPRADQERESLKRAATQRPLDDQELRRLKDLISIQKDLAATTHAATKARNDKITSVLNWGKTIDSVLGNPTMKTAANVLGVDYKTWKKAVRS